MKWREIVHRVFYQRQNCTYVQQRKASPHLEDASRSNSPMKDFHISFPWNRDSKLSQLSLPWFKGRRSDTLWTVETIENHSMMKRSWTMCWRSVIIQDQEKLFETSLGSTLSLLEPRMMEGHSSGVPDDSIGFRPGPIRGKCASSKRRYKTCIY